MNARSRSWALTAIGTFVMMLIPAAIVVGVVVGAGAPDPPHQPNAVVSRTADGPSTVPSPVAAVDPLSAHQTMLEQMRVNVTPQMIQTMNANPLAHSPGDLAELERHAADIDRMLARNP